MRKYKPAESYKAEHEKLGKDIVWDIIAALLLCVVVFGTYWYKV
jgi:hypothetical protein